MNTQPLRVIAVMLPWLALAAGAAAQGPLAPPPHHGMGGPFYPQPTQYVPHAPPTMAPPYRLPPPPGYAPGFPPGGAYPVDGQYGPPAQDYGPPPAWMRPAYPAPVLAPPGYGAPLHMQMGGPAPPGMVVGAGFMQDAGGQPPMMAPGGPVYGGASPGGPVYGGPVYGGPAYGGPVYGGSAPVEMGGYPPGAYPVMEGPGPVGGPVVGGPEYVGAPVTSFLDRHGPAGTGGCCEPRWFDVAVDFMHLWREDSTRRVNFTSLGVNGPIILASTDLEMGGASGFRAIGTLLLNCYTYLEAGYYGTFWWDGQEVVRGPGNLFSAFSEFGTNPPGGFAETDSANLHSISYRSQLDSFELNLRQRYVSCNCRLHKSYLIGVRYIRLDEQFAFHSEANGTADYVVDTNNDLIGLQIGGDMFFCVLPGLVIGGDLKGGVYGNITEQETNVAFTNPAATFQEQAAGGAASTVVELNALAAYKICPWLSFRGGYHFLYMQGLALGPENFNSQPFNLGPRDVSVDSGGHAFWHGMVFGLEGVW